jgi:hypothetical protein
VGQRDARVSAAAGRGGDARNHLAVDADPLRVSAAGVRDLREG